MRPFFTISTSTGAGLKLFGLFLAMCLIAGCGKKEKTSSAAISKTDTPEQHLAVSRITNSGVAAYSTNLVRKTNDLSAPTNLSSMTNSPTGGEMTEAQKKAMEIYNLGVQHFQGDGVPRSPSEALKYFRQAAEMGHPGAQHNLGVFYLTGTAVTNDASEAFKWMSKSAEQGLAEAQFKIASLYATGVGTTQDMKQAVQWVRKAAEQGHREAQYNLATLYAAGQGIGQDLAQAAQWYRKAAEQGQVIAQSNLGVLYARGEGVAKDPVEAAKWFAKAAEQGHPGAQYNLARSYAEGSGVEKNNVEAYKWYMLSAELGDRDAAKARLELSIGMKAAQIAEAIRIANAFSARLEASRTNIVTTLQTNAPAIVR